MTTPTVTRTPKAKAPKTTKAEQPKKAEQKKTLRRSTDSDGNAVPTVYTEQNGVTMPMAGKTRQVWDFCDSFMDAAERAPTRAEALAKLQEVGINFHTVSTQYGRWRKFMGIGGRLPKAGA